MNQGVQNPETTPHQDPDVGTACTTCGDDVRRDPAEAGLNCARCGQWHSLCDDCTPNVSEHSRDATWMCPTCRARPLDS